KVMIHARHDTEQRGFAGAVGAQDTDLSAGIKRQPDPAQYLPRWRDDLAQILHYINELWGHAPNLTAEDCGPANNCELRTNYGLRTYCELRTKIEQLRTF